MAFPSKPFLSVGSSAGSWAPEAGFQLPRLPQLRARLPRAQLVLSSCLKLRATHRFLCAEPARLLEGVPERRAVPLGLRDSRGLMGGTEEEPPGPAPMYRGRLPCGYPRQSRPQNRRPLRTDPQTCHPERVCNSLMTTGRIVITRQTQCEHALLGKRCQETCLMQGAPPPPPCGLCGCRSCEASRGKASEDAVARRCPPSSRAPLAPRSALRAQGPQAPWASFPLGLSSFCPHSGCSPLSCLHACCFG